MIDLVKFPTPSLKEKSVEVDLKNQDTIIFLMDFLGFYAKINFPNPRAVGLACPQVGNNIRAFIALGDLYVNPVMLEKSQGTYEAWEGCLSLVEGMQYKVRRHKTIKLKWQGPDEVEHTQEFSGFEAQVIQHEYDHLEGILINDK